LVSGQLPLELVGGSTVHSPRAVLKANGTPYTVFTPYRRRWSELSLPSTRAILPAPESISGPTDLESDPIPATRGLASTGSFIAGEHEAARRLQAFIDGEDSPVHHYGDLRDRLDVRGTSELSPYLRFGMLSARQVVVSALTAVEAAADEEAHASAQSWLEELIWREFYISILYHFPDVMRASFRRELQGIRWSNDRGAFQAWCEGRTGYPVVDAAMRQLSQRGWMPNRARMIVASFLVKDLLIDWRWGEQWFMQHLVDGDLAANNGGWQWTAGTGTDAAPYFRIFNPITQAKKHDPDGIYVRRWIPELARVPRERIHEPWKMDVEIQRGAGCLIGRDYPAPIVDHAWARDRVLGAYAAARLSDP
jgi:deoxyribodipyrimidine photo-lyase